MKMKITIAIFLVCLIFLMLGCSGGGSPTVPSAPDQQDIASYNNLPVGVSEVDQNGAPVAGFGTLGLFEVNIDPGSLTGEMHSLRNVSSEDVLEVVDITNFLQIAPCSDCAKIDGVEINADGNVVVYMGIRHPFAPGDPLKPITGANRGDLHVFNVEGLVVAETGNSLDFPATGATISDAMLLNADGYSPYLDNVLDGIFTTAATLHPYVLHFDDYTAGNYDPLYPMGFQSVTNPPPSGNLVMAMGSDYDVQAYEFSFGAGDSIDFIYAVGCTYAVSADTKIDRFTPEYRVPQHLKKAASEVSVRIIDNTLEEGNTSSSATIAIDVVDISHGVEVGSALNQMRADSSVGTIRLEIPGVLLTAVDVDLTNTGGTGHDPADPLTYEATFTNEANASLGFYSGLVKVTDTYPAGANESILLLGNDGIERVGPTDNPLTGLFAIPEFATYQVFEIELVGVINEDPIADLQPEQIDIYTNGTVDFDATASSDTDGTIVLYEFDFDWDGVEANFVADDSNATGLVTSLPYALEGTYTAGLRVTDNLGGTGYDSSQIDVTEWSGECPNAPFGGVNFGTNNFVFVDDGHFSNLPNWELFSDMCVDADGLSDGRGVTIYSDEGTGMEGELRLFEVDQSGYDYLEYDWPGERGVSVDIDSEDLIVFVTAATLPHIDNDEFLLSQRIDNSNTYFTVVDPSVGTSSAQDIQVGDKIVAVEIDGYDDVWVLDINNVVHRYVKTNNYGEDTARQFDLDTSTSSALTGDIFDFVIDFYNEAFFFLEFTGTNADVWRIECDGTYFASVNGNDNPMVNVFHDGATPYNITYNGIGIADIAIDNLDSAGDQLTGMQDSQIVCVSGVNSGGWDTVISRIDSELGQMHTAYITSGTGLSNGFFNQTTNRLYGFERDFWSDAWLDWFDAPSDWD